MPVSIDDLFLPAAEQAEGLRQGRFTSLELTEAYLDRIEQVNPTVSAYVQVDRKGAIAAAIAADARIQAGDSSPVLGLCVAIKDLIDVAGLRTTYGSRAFADNVAAEDAPVISRLREAGAVILGKVNTTEFALFSPSMIADAPRNPWDFERTAGGSSNGSAVAVSAGLCSFAVGTDTAGSIRTPSSFTGISGLKPTHGRVSAKGIGELSTFMDTVGPMARSPRDIALALQVMAGYEPSDLTSAERPVPDYREATTAGVAGLRIGVPESYMADALDPEIESAWRSVAELLANEGAVTAPVTLPDTSEAMTIWRGLVVGDAAAWHEDGLRKRGDLYSDGSRMLLESNAGALAIEVAKARKEQWTLRQAYLAAISGFDAILLPGAPVIAPLDTEIVEGSLTSGDRKVGGQVMLDYAIPFNVTGLPALVVPVAASKMNGMPLPIMIVATHFREDIILKIAAAVEKLQPFNTRPERFR